MNTFTLGACFQHELHTGPYFMTFAPRLYLKVDKVDLILSRADIFETPKDIDDFTNCPTHRSNLGVGWSRGSSSRCRVPK